LPKTAKSLSRDDVISDVIKNDVIIVYRQRRTFNKSCKSNAERI